MSTDNQSNIIKKAHNDCEYSPGNNLNAITNAIDRKATSDLRNNSDVMEITEEEFQDYLKTLSVDQLSKMKEAIYQGEIIVGNNEENPDGRRNPARVRKR